MKFACCLVMQSDSYSALYIVNGLVTLLQTHKEDALESNKNLAFD